MKLSRIEQKTVILYNEAEASAEVFTYDTRLPEKLIRLCEKYLEQITRPAARKRALAVSFIPPVRMPNPQTE